MPSFSRNDPDCIGLFESLADRFSQDLARSSAAMASHSD